tara:strand:- start:1009 stop:1182 length:174 start_codon:yes stop_codon:yes gene_type:complete
MNKSVEDKKIINDIIKDIIDIEKQALYGNAKSKHTIRRGKVADSIARHYKKLKDHKK